MEFSTNQVVIWSVACAICLSFVYRTAVIDAASASAALCPSGSFLKGDLYCVPDCGSGYFGHTASRTCQKCSSSCKTCLNGESSDICSSCDPPLYLKESSCVQSCGNILAKSPPFQRLRLVGKSHFEGRVEVFHDGSWGTVCDDLWDINDANVVCGELLLGNAQEAVNYGRLGQGSPSQPIWLSMVNCKGNESRLEECQHAGWGNHSCGHFEDAGVRCKGPDTNRECVPSCGDGYYVKRSKHHCGPCSANCLTCDGSPTACTSCDTSKYLKGQTCVESCGEGMYGNAVSRKCKLCDPGCRTCADGESPENCTSCPDDRYLNGTQCVVSCAPFFVAQRRTIRLAGINRTTELEGRVEVFRDGAWKTVCDKTFDFREATVACRQLGLGRALRAVKRGYYGRGTGPIWSEVINCTGREESLFSCPHGPPVPLRFMGCYHSVDVGVACAGPQSSPPLSNRCLKKCERGWYKNDFDVCDVCAAQCFECRGSSQLCTNCSAPRFVRNSSCVEKCADDEYGHLPSRRCEKCNQKSCLTCINSRDNCTSCKPPKALQDGKCRSRCEQSFYQKQGVCVKDCGVSFYAHANGSCLRCPHDCVQCTSPTSCSLCAPPLVFESKNSLCVANCSGDRFSVPFNMSLQAEQLIRLSNGSDYLEGVLEVKHEGVWGTVCDDGWDKRESDVVCRQLNLGTAVQGVSLTHIKKGTGKQWLDDVFCMGSEMSLMDCQHRRWGETNCGHDEDTVLRCSGPGFRRCQDSCLPAQYSKGKECFHCNIACADCSESPSKCGKCAKGYFKKGNDTCVADCGYGYFLDGVCKKCATICGDCVGKSDNCTSCQKPLYKDGQTCVKVCPKYNPPLNPIVRLRDGKTSFEGRVEIYHNGEYGTVCDDRWDLKDAQVVCRMLGMGNATEAVSRARFGRGSGRVWMDDVDCVGNETSLSSCPFRGWERENCDHSEDAGVVCQRPGNWGECIDSCDVNNGSFVDNSKGVSCVTCSADCKTCAGNPDNCTSCFPEMFLNKTTLSNSSNCVKSCGARDFSDGVTRRCLPCNDSCFSCEGVSGNCTSCDKNLKLSGSKCVSQCGASEKLLTGVQGIRLVGASSMLEGRVEIFHNGEWGTICDDNFDIRDAHVVCRQLKMGTAVEARNRGKYGEGKGRIWIDDLQCFGHEINVKDCAMNSGGLGSHNCKHIEDAGVKCSGPDMSQVCVATCRAGYFESNKNCERCALKCKECRDKADSCQRCDPPYFHQSSDCVTKCPRGYYGNTKNQSCTACSKVCQTCFNGETGDQCQSCPKGLFLNGTTCVKDCGDLRSVSSLFVSKPGMPLVRLVGGGNKQEGRVEVLHDGVWGTVCDDDWDQKEATIVCKELGFGYAKEAPRQSRFGKGSGVIWMDNVDCLGYESSITQCRQAGWGLGNCDPDHNEDAGVVCDNTTVEQLSNNYCRKVNTGSCADLRLCDSHAEVTCVDLEIFNKKGEEQSVCLQCPDGFTGDGQRCRAVSPKPPVFDKKPINYTEVTLQDVIKLNCSSRSPLVLPSVWDWKKDGKPLAPEDIRTKRITSASGELVIRSAQVEDSGNYRCTLVNTAGFIESNDSVVVVKAFPQIPGVVSANVAMGDTATLGCLVSSFPKANITWSFKGKNLTVGGDKRKRFLDSNYTLQIREVSFADDGTYECYVFNELGAAVADVKLTVGKNIKYQNFKTRVVAKKGGDVTLSCDVEAVPMATLTWKKDGVLVTSGERYLLLLTSQGNNRLAKLKILGVDKADMGRYACIARNQNGLQAMVARVVLTGPPIIDLTPSDKSVLSGANVSFFCVGVGDPVPSLTWLKDSKQIRPSTTKMIDSTTGELRLTSVTVEDGGSYTCVYKNEHGEAKQSVVLTVDGHAGLGPPTTRTRKSSGLSTGGLVAIVVMSLLVLLVVLAVVIYKCRGHPNYKRGDRLMEGGSTRFSDLKTRVQSSFGRSYDSPYQPQTE